MPGVFSQRVFPLLQLTRMALVFTAVSNSLAALLILARWRAGAGQPLRDVLRLEHAAVVALISVGLYGFGMSLNDIIDRRRDRQLAAHRPLPSGSIGVVTAHVICAALGLLALVGGALYSRWTGQAGMSLLLVAWTGVLIAFYDLAGKYLVAPGLLTLGLIRFFHAIIPAPQLPLLWHPLLLLNHVTLLSLVAYQWEEKRPPLTRAHWWGVLGGLAAVDVLSIAMVWRRGMAATQTWQQSLQVEPALLIPLGCVVAFVLLAWHLRRTSVVSREAGQSLMLYGLLWVIVYDVAFVAGFVGVLPALALLVLLPIAYGSVQLMRWWSRLIALSQRPAFKRVDV